ncbi:hypothetical protein CIK77_03430 [Microbacterium sp. JB110]|nr:hypothetical protein CIK77_03430 [Microbacterium sp. JB110]
MTAALVFGAVAGGGLPAAAAEPEWVAAPADHVDTLNGTGIGGDVVGSINNFPAPPCRSAWRSSRRTRRTRTPGTSTTTSR